MRFRLHTVPPLPPYKAWYVLPAAVTDDASSTVLDIKRALCSNVLSDSSPDQLALFIDDFEILDGTSVEVVQPGDLITAKQRAVSAAGVGTKRKARTDEDIQESPKKKPKLVTAKTPPLKPSKPPGRAASSSISSDPSSSDSSSTSDTSSSSKTDSDSDSDSSSSSASSSASRGPKRPAKQPPLKPATDPLSGHDFPLANRTTRVDVQPSSFVPPGQGKPSTQARNARRRRRQQAVKGTQPNGNVSSAPEASPERPLQVPELPVQVTATMLRNKGKRKQFLASSSGGPERIVFNADTDQDGEQQPRRQLPRLIPPSERTDLPPNVFVTSVDVEADLWARRKRKAKRVEFAYDESASYAADAEVSMAADEAAPAPAPDLDIKWPALAQLTAAPPVGTMLAWKALDINPATLSPEVMLHTGCVLALDAAAGTVKLGIAKADVAFGATRAEDVEQDEEPEEVDMTLADIIGNDDWRVLA
ncbi:hypothetical protein AURDEDRAFT_154733 [Auricularia subglabra TFB-10046 SS5]|uniref:Coilin n=1 Tax=Auricularia subglabra (strain TFB-10046 / SS5) TaxID=717982 RepID=J0LFB8_AURST|nr:hypothetical protein AURDEDRAFT_154733 [Auricularia subglabra TFB-10046 SS5]